MTRQERRQLLFEKATANAQRRAREKFLCQLEQPLRDQLELAKYMVFPDTEPIIRMYFSADEKGIGPERARPPGYRFERLQTEAEVLATFHKMSLGSFGPRAHLCIGVVEVIRFDNAAFCIPELPLFTVDSVVVEHHFETLWQLSRGCFSLVRQDATAGVLVDSYYDCCRKVWDFAVWDDDFQRLPIQE